MQVFGGAEDKSLQVVSVDARVTTRIKPGKRRATHAHMAAVVLAR
jgi:hypothetical protein